MPPCDAWWRAANYSDCRARSTCSPTRCCAEPLERAGHQAAAARATGARRPGLNLLWTHLNRADPSRGTSNADVPGRAGARRPGDRWRTRGWRAPTARSTRTSAADAVGMQRLFRQFSFPGGIPSHVAPETPGSIHEGGELGYVAHATPTARRWTTPTCVVACVVGDGEAETGPLAAIVAREQVRRPGPRRRCAADPAPERLQDRQPDRARPHPAASELTSACCAATATRC